VTATFIITGELVPDGPRIHIGDSVIPSVISPGDGFNLPYDGEVVPGHQVTVFCIAEPPGVSVGTDLSLYSPTGHVEGYWFIKTLPGMTTGNATFYFIARDEDLVGVMQLAAVAYIGVFSPTQPPMPTKGRTPAPLRTRQQTPAFPEQPRTHRRHRQRQPRGQQRRPEG
jgi:hypothetical protein